jgi:hypothetical protein
MDSGNHLVDAHENDKEWHRRKEEEQEEEEPCDSCKRLISVHDHYVNGGLCWKCIENIGK